MLRVFVACVGDDLDSTISRLNEQLSSGDLVELEVLGNADVIGADKTTFWLNAFMNSVLVDEHLRSVRLQRVPLSNDAALLVKSLLARCGKLQSFGIEGCELTNSALAFIFDALVRLRSMEEIVVRDNFTSPSETMIKNLIEMIQNKCRYFRVLELSNYGLLAEKKDLKLLLDALKHPQCWLKCLKLGRIKLEDKECFGSMISENLSLEELVLGEENEFADGVVESVFQAIERSRSLKVVEVHFKSLSSVQVKAIGKALSVNRMLSSLKFRYFGVQQAVMEHLGEGLTESCLKKIVLEAPALSTPPDSLIPFLQSLRNKNFSLQSLIVLRTNIGIRFIKALSKSIAENRTLECLRLRECSVDGAQTKLLIEAISVNDSLAYVDLSHNHVPRDAVKGISGITRSNHSLVSLNLDFNPELKIENKTSSADASAPEFSVHPPVEFASARRVAVLCSLFRKRDAIDLTMIQLIMEILPRDYKGSLPQEEYLE